jgi:hypothetical protein
MLCGLKSNWHYGPILIHFKNILMLLLIARKEFSREFKWVIFFIKKSILMAPLFMSNKSYTLECFVIAQRNPAL